MDGWEIKRPLGQCSGSGRKIEYDQEYFAALVETAEGLERRDFSVEYWEQNKPQVYCYWKTKLQRPDQKKQIFIDDGMLMSFFERLATETEQEKVNFRFVLGLILIRKRMLVYEEARKEGDKEIWVVRFRGKDQRMDLLDPKLNEQQVLEVSQQLGEILNEEL